MFVRIEESEAEKLALVLDSVEADLVGLQHRVFRVRDKLQQKAGKPCGHRYEGPNERGGAKDDGTTEMLDALKNLVAYSECSVNDADIWKAARAAIAKAEGKAVAP